MGQLGYYCSRVADYQTPGGVEIVMQDAVDSKELTDNELEVLASACAVKLEYIHISSLEKIKEIIQKELKVREEIRNEPTRSKTVCN